ncbi:hypothetical protein E1B28_006899 [Marasmius oreades]|uniref:Uncharacterized protein n=1 Tax=Marasmius oreades TaxID=181124 RepID=A0A9P7UT80_9AGAR|nr:uncharacterized protein E1B28_006899 [Marasmius oreades]KAG7093213.1 hypothetical protein E1B28_006899 [Marasmius oreades]
MSLPTTEIQDDFEEPFDWTNIYHHDPPNEDEIEHNIDWDDGLAWAKLLAQLRGMTGLVMSTLVIPTMKMQRARKWKLLRAAVRVMKNTTQSSLRIKALGNV